jgi:hypothetical protein
MNRLSINEWKKYVRLYEEGEASTKEFCIHHNLSFSTFCKKRKLFSSKGVDTSFQEISLAPSTIKVKISGVDVEVNPSDLKHILQVLQ